MGDEMGDNGKLRRARDFAKKRRVALHIEVG